MAAYATATELGGFLGQPAPPDADRLLARASELLDGEVTTPFDVSADTDLPTDTTVAAALRDACCAQVEFWLEVGEDHDVTGLSGGVAVGSLRLDHLPPVVGPRARRLLGNGGLLGIGVALPHPGTARWLP